MDGEIDSEKEIRFLESSRNAIALSRVSVLAILVFTGCVPSSPRAKRWWIVEENISVKEAERFGWHYCMSLLIYILSIGPPFCKIHKIFIEKNQTEMIAHKNKMQLNLKLHNPCNKHIPGIVVTKECLEYRTFIIHIKEGK